MVQLTQIVFHEAGILHIRTRRSYRKPGVDCKALLVELVAAPEKAKLALFCGLVRYHGEARHLDVEFLVVALQ